jgi:beta-phosphoglucomutase-like phosphatase (HAD superfamily)
LCGNHIPLAICSGALKEEIESMLRGIGLRECFGIITAAEDVTIGKPDPQGYLLTAKVLSEQIGSPIRPEDCLVIEDAPTVARSVRAAGFKVLAVATTYPADKLRDAHYITQTLAPAEVQRAIPQLQLSRH